MFCFQWFFAIQVWIWLQIQHNLGYQQFADIIDRLLFHKLNFKFDKIFVKNCCKKLKENSAGLQKLCKKNRNTTASDFLESFFKVNLKKIYPERLENRSLESILNENKELTSKLYDLTRKISSLEETISAANQCVTGKVKRGKTLFLQIK